MNLSSLSKLSLALLCLASAALPLHAEQATARRIVFAQSSPASYALVREGQRTTFVGSHRSGDTEVDALKQHYPGNFIWFQNDGKAYVVRDPATLAKVDAAWAPADKLGQDMKLFDAPMREKSRAMNALGREMATAAQGGKSARGETEAIGKRMDALGKEMDALGKQMGSLGKQIERESKQADASTRALLQTALASGAAQVIPPTMQ